MTVFQVAVIAAFLGTGAGVALTCSGCSDSVRSVHPTRAAAQPDIDRGWIPPVLPASATQIRERHDLDANVGHGTFAFAASDAEQFRAALVPLAPTQPLRPQGVSRSEFERRGSSFYTHGDFDIAVN